jgi:ribosomal-protein-alanine N-acetyltransferase
LTTQTLALFTPKESDLPAFAELDRLCLGGMWSLDGYRREWESAKGFLLGLRNGDGLRGVAAFWQILEEAHITLLMVHPQYRSRGWGRLLLLTLLAEARLRRSERATLEVRASNQKAFDLYFNLGFRLAGTRKGYYDNPVEDAHILWLNGLQTPIWERRWHNHWRDSQARLAQQGLILTSLGEGLLIQWG